MTRGGKWGGGREGGGSVSKERKMESLVSSEVRRGEGGMRVGEFDNKKYYKKGNNFLIPESWVI